MKFESVFGMHEICIYTAIRSREGFAPRREFLVKVVGITFNSDESVTYMVEHMTEYAGLQRFPADHTSLTGDPDYDQDLGGYRK